LNFESSPFANRNALFDRIHMFALRMAQVAIENMDYRRLLKTYDHPGNLFFLDPPYLGSDVSNYQGWTEIDMGHFQLGSVLREQDGTPTGEGFDVAGSSRDVRDDVFEEPGFSSGPANDRFGCHDGRDFYAARFASSRFFAARKSKPPRPRW